MNDGEVVLDSSSVSFDSLSIGLEIAIIVVGILIALAAVAALVMSIYLAIKYIKFNNKMTKANVKGKDVARALLDKNELSNIKVVRASLFMSFMVGNSYSHYFKRVRLRGLVYNKPSITSVAIAGEKVGLALLDKEKDPDMVKRIRLLPIVTFGPFMFLPLVIIGFILDILVFNMTGICSLIFIALGFMLYVWAFILSYKQLVTEKKAQERAITMLTEDNYIAEDELDDVKELFKLYNINYIINMIIALLELIRQILKIVLSITRNSKIGSK